MKQLSQSTNIISLLRLTWLTLSKKRHYQIKLLFFIIFLNSIAEIICITLLFPYLGVIINPESLSTNNLVNSIGKILGVNQPEELILPLTIFFLIATIISGFVRYLFNFYALRVSSNIGSDLSINAYKTSINRPYKYHLSKNSNILITTITKDISEIVYFIFNPSFHLISAIIISVSIVSTLLIINFAITLTTFIFLLVIYFLFLKFSAKTIRNISKRNVLFSQNITKLVQESLGGIRDVILSNNQKYYINQFQNNDRIYRREESFGNFLNLAPRLIIEPIAIALVASFGFFLVKVENNQNVIPILGAFSFSALRLLPFAQRLYEGITLPKLAKSRLINLLEILKNPPKEKRSIFKKKQKLVLKNNIQLKNVSYGYLSEGPLILKNLNFTINLGEKIGIIGKTGSGKSTLIDLIMGLIEPTSGNILIDKKDLFKGEIDKNVELWQNSIMHVPQNIFLSDATIAENIAFGVHRKDIDLNRVYDAAEKSQLIEFVEKKAKGFETEVGEKGIRLSGGQRQRIGIARALYKKSRIIFLDEATSALDRKTEELVMGSFKNLGSEVTIIIITHRVNTLLNCEKVFELKDGKLELRKDLF